MKEILKLIIMPFTFITGWWTFGITNKTPKLAFAGFRYMFVLTNGRSNDCFSRLISWRHPKREVKKAKGILGDLNQDDINKLCKEIDENGFAALDVTLTEEMVKDITKFAETTPVRYLEYDKKLISYSKEEIIFDENNRISPRFQYRTEQILANQTIQDLCFDDSLRAVANNYLGCEPIVDIMTMWWSLPYGKEAEDKAAQMYHFDMDRFKFFKFFFYLTDVDTNTGPHCYVRNTHKRLPKSIQEDRRITDEEIAQTYPAEDILELCGKKGSIIAVDTRGMHKGKSLTEGKRLLFQIQFSNSLFGQTYPEVENVVLSPENQKKKEQYQRTYQLING